MSLERIEITPFAVIAGDILQNRRSGSLTIIRASQRNVLFWSQGELVLIIPPAPDDTLAQFLLRRGAITRERAADIAGDDPINAVARFHETGTLDLSARQTLLREWLKALFIPFFSLDDGTAVFSDEDAIDPERRVFLQSTASLVLEGVRAITNGLLLRRSLGDLKREIEPARDGRLSMESIALTDAERHVASSLTGPITIEAFLKRAAPDSVGAAKVVIGLLALGVFKVVDVSASRTAPATPDFDDMQRDLELLAAIGSSDHRSLRAVGLSRQMASMDHYRILDVPRAATRAQILSAAESMKRVYDPASYPPIVRDAVMSIHRRIDDAVNVLKEPSQRAEYDRMLSQPAARRPTTGDGSIQQKLTQRSIAQHNFNRARELTVSGDYYGAIVLLKQAVEFAPEMADAWFLLASCQERNPKWRRDAAVSYQKALSADPNHVEAMISLGDLYRMEGLTSRAQTCYEDALKIAPDNQQAKSRLGGLKKR
ncbi:MAG TPA: tetratricopeptide repeat protein [Thermoanaerobaculia bacterium]